MGRSHGGGCDSERRVQVLSPINNGCACGSSRTNLAHGSRGLDSFSKRFSLLRLGTTRYPAQHNIRFRLLIIRHLTVFSLSPPGWCVSRSHSKVYMFLLRPANGISSLQAFFFSFFSLPEILVCSSVSYLEGGENQVKEKKGWGGGWKKYMCTYLKWNIALYYREEEEEEEV